MSSAEHIALVRRYYEECANDDGDPDKQRALAVADELLTTDFAMVYNNQTAAEATHGLDAHKAFLVRHTRAFRGERWIVEAMVADEQTVACRWRIRATHTNTGNAVDLRAADFFTVRQGRLAALHRILDFRTLEAQLAPAPPPHAAQS